MSKETAKETEKETEKERQEQIEIECEKWRQQIQPVSIKEQVQAKKHWDSLGKPIGGLGDLEDVIIRMAGIKRNSQRLSLDRIASLVFCADHGVVKEGVTQTGQDVTKIVADNFTQGKTTLCVLAAQCGADIFPIDIGINCEPYPEKALRICQVADRKIRKGSGNICIEAAMTQAQCIRAVQTGIDVVAECREMGYNAVILGEMGIGNTTPTSVLTSILLHCDAAEVTGRGAGLDDSSFAHKIKVVEQIKKRVDEHKIPENMPLQILMEAGGLEIAGMAGACIGGAIYGMPVILDGVISNVAAVLADRVDSRIRDYLFASHNSREPAGERLLSLLGLTPLLECHMGLGEGTGAMLAVPVFRMALGVYRNMNTFHEIGVEAYKPC